MTECLGHRVQVCDASPEDAAEMLAINNAATPHVNPVSAPEFDLLLNWSAMALKAVDGGRPVGLVLCLPAGLPYGSANYRHLSGWFDEFLYVDRIAVTERVRGTGVGRRLYETVIARAAGRWPRVVCEVNENPPNPVSMAFHHRLGFENLEPFDNPDNGKRVRMMQRPL